MNFISKNLVMGALRNTLLTGESDNSEIYDEFIKLVEEDDYSYDNVDVMLFTIVELAGSAGYNSILYQEPLPIEEYKTFLYRTVRLIIESHRITTERGSCILTSFLFPLYIVKSNISKILVFPSHEQR